MGALLIAGFLALGLLGFALLYRFGAAGKENAAAASEGFDQTEAPLMFFENEQQGKELEAALDHLFPDRLVPSSPDIPANARPRVVVALLRDDADNLLLCTRAMRLRKDCVTLARCHEVTIAPLFAQRKITHVLTAPPTNQTLLSIFQGGSTTCINNVKA